MGLQQEGHNNDWIYPDGPAPGPIKGSASHYYNQWKWDSEPGPFSSSAPASYSSSSCSSLNGSVSVVVLRGARAI